MSEQTQTEYSKTQEKVATAFYILFVAASIVTILGGIWTAAEFFIGTTGKFEWFISLNFGLKIVIIAALFAGLFFLLVFCFGFFKKGQKKVLRWAFKAKPLNPEFRNRTDVKAIALGFLFSLVGVIVGVVLFVGVEILTLLTSATPSATVEALSNGTICLLIGFTLFILCGLSIFVIYFIKNGYYLVLKLIGGLEKQE